MQRKARIFKRKFVAFQIFESSFVGDAKFEGNLWFFECRIDQRSVTRQQLGFKEGVRVSVGQGVGLGYHKVGPITVHGRVSPTL